MSIHETYVYYHVNIGKGFKGHPVMPELERPGGPLAPQYLADQLTLFEPGRADYPHL